METVGRYEYSIPGFISYFSSTIFLINFPLNFVSTRYRFSSVKSVVNFLRFYYVCLYSNRI